MKPGVGIFRRQLLGTRSEYDSVWFFRKRIQLRNRLKLEETWSEGIDAELQPTFTAEFTNAMRTAECRTYALPMPVARPPRGVRVMGRGTPPRAAEDRGASLCERKKILEFCLLCDPTA